MFNLLEYILSQAHTDHLKQIIGTSKPRGHIEFLINTSLVSILKTKSISPEDFGFDDEYELRCSLIESLEDNTDIEIKNYIESILKERNNISGTLKIEKIEPSITIHDTLIGDKTKISNSIITQIPKAASSAEGGNKKKKNIKK